MAKIPQHVIEQVEGRLSPDGRRILAWLIEHRAELDMPAIEAAAEPLRAAGDQAMAALGIQRDPSEYLGYAIESILYS